MFGGDLVSVGFILFIAFLLFGPKKLPDIARTLGKGMAELRRASYELRNTFEEEIRNIDRPSEGIAELRRASHDFHNELEEEIRNIDRPSEGAPDSAPHYGHNYPEPSRKEPESGS